MARLKNKSKFVFNTYDRLSEEFVEDEADYEPVGIGLDMTVFTTKDSSHWGLDQEYCWNFCDMPVKLDFVKPSSTQERMTCEIISG